MPRQPDPARKPRLLAEIIACMADRPLSAMTFRAVAEHLDVSTFSLVYHFGSKDNLVAEVVAHICDAQWSAFRAAVEGRADADDYFDGIRVYWDWVLVPRNHQMLRVAIEAAMVEALRVDGGAVTRAAHAAWHEWTAESLVAVGLDPEEARIEAAAITTVLTGLQVDLIVTGDGERVTAALEREAGCIRERIASSRAEPESAA